MNRQVMKLLVENHFFVKREVDRFSRRFVIVARILILWHHVE